MAVVIHNQTNVIEFTAQGDAYDNRIFVRAISWEGTIAINSDLKITDSNGDLLIEEKNGTANEPHLHEFPFFPGKAVDGIIMETLDAGKVSIYLW